MLKFYADESVNDSTSLLNLSGYVMTEDQFIALDSAIQRARGDLPYFHMKEGHHRRHPKIYRDLVSLITPQSVLAGVSVSVYLKEFERIASLKVKGRPYKYWFGGSYAYAVGSAMALCSAWLNESDYRNELVAYVFENHPSQGDADAFWSMLNKPQYEKRKQDLHYASHTFVDGKGPLGSVLQVCDILAWNLNKMQREKRKTRELNRLLLTPTCYRHNEQKAIARSIQLSLDHWKKFDKAGRPYLKATLAS